MSKPSYEPLEPQEAADLVAERIVELVSRLLEGKRWKFRDQVTKIAQRMRQIGNGATDRRDLLARYKRLVDEEFSNLTAWEFCLALQIIADQKEQTAIEAEAFAVAALTGIVVERRAEMEDRNPGNFKLAVRQAFSEVTSAELFSALERLTAERFDKPPLPTSTPATWEPKQTFPKLRKRVAHILLAVKERAQKVKT